MRPFRHWRARSFPACVVLAAAIVLGWAAAQAAPALRPENVSQASDVGLTGIRFGGDAVATRMVLDLDAAVTGKLVDDESAAGHLVIALPPLLSTGPLQGPGKGMVTGWSLHDDAAGARLVLDASAGATVVRRFLI